MVYPQESHKQSTKEEVKASEPKPNIDIAKGRKSTNLNLITNDLCTVLITVAVYSNSKHNEAEVGAGGFNLWLISPVEKQH